MNINRDGVIKPLNITDLRSGKTLEYAKAFDGAGNPIESSVDFPISEAQKGIKEVQSLTQKTLTQKTLSQQIKQMVYLKTLMIIYTQKKLLMNKEIRQFK